MSRQDITVRFTAETADHQMTVLHDDGLYRHLRFRAPTTSMFWFDLITVPGTLFFQGDGESWTFRRIEDMFEFFRGQRVNPGYWSEKLTSGRNECTKYDPDLFERRVMEAFTEDAQEGDVPPGTAAALRRDVLEQADLGEHVAREALDAFEHDGYRFVDTWEWSFQDYDWWFLWSLHAIVWGISVYDGKPITSWSGPAPRPATQPRTPLTRPVETVPAAGGVL